LLTWVRPGGGISPGYEKEVIGKKTIRSLEQGELINLKDLVAL